MAEIVFGDYRFDTGLMIVFASVFVLLVWVFLKLFRIVQTPLIFELMPIITGISAVFGMGGFCWQNFADNKASSGK